jgi:hypothetical protein
MPSVRSSLSPEVSALSWRIARYGPPPTTLSTTLTVPQRTKANKEAIESLAPRVKALAESLCKPVSEGDVKERERRREVGTVSPHSPGSRTESDVWGLAGNCKMFVRDLAPLEEQGKVEGFFNNAENAGKLGGLVEDIRDAMMEYQVCGSNCSFVPRLTFVLDFTTQGIYNKQQDINDKSIRGKQRDHRESHSSPPFVHPRGLTDG